MNIEYTPYFGERDSDIINPNMKPIKRVKIEERINDPGLLKKYRRGNIKKIIKYVMKEAKKEFDDIFLMNIYNHKLIEGILYVTIEGTLYKKV